MQEEILTADEFAKKAKVSKAAVRRWTCEGMPCLRLGGRLVRFEFGKALAWLEQRQKRN
jgi:phage terminase Nu1 subunit (DNA packaging protein)